MFDMFSLRQPSEHAMRTFLAEQSGKPFSYEEVGMSQEDDVPDRFSVDRYRVQLGRGQEVFERAAEAVRTWKVYPSAWMTLYPPNAPVVKGTSVAILAHLPIIWGKSAVRIVYVIEEPRRYGFALGTLPKHIESGEERFSVEWLADDSVWYEILAISRPRHPLAKLGYPVARLVQKRFGHDSKEAVKQFVQAQVENRANLR